MNSAAVRSTRLSTILGLVNAKKLTSIDQIINYAKVHYGVTDLTAQDYAGTVYRKVMKK